MLVATPVGIHLLDQATYWHAWGDEGRLVQLLLDDMTPTHQRRLLAWLRRNSVRLLEQEMDRVCTQQRRGQLTDEEFGQALAELQDADPDVWIEDRPLVRRLVQLVPRTHLPRRGLLRGRRWWR